jgi:hypothetical protein
MGRFKAREHSEQQSLALSTTSTVVSFLGRGGAAAAGDRAPNETTTTASRGLLSCFPWLATRGANTSCGFSFDPSPAAAPLPTDGAFIATPDEREVR